MYDVDMVKFFKYVGISKKVEIDEGVSDRVIDDKYEDIIDGLVVLKKDLLGKHIHFYIKKQYYNSHKQLCQELLRDVQKGLVQKNYSWEIVQEPNGEKYYEAKAR